MDPQGFGGKGANQAVQAALLGAETAFVGKLGVDGTGDSTAENFAKHNIDVKQLCVGAVVVEALVWAANIARRFVVGTRSTRTTEAPSAVAPIMVDAEGTNCIIVVSGANMKLTVRRTRRC